MSQRLDNLTSSVVTVGGGRGFVVSLRRNDVIVTAAHCLPYLPPQHPSSFSHERSYVDLVGPLGETPSLACECLFVDPISDLAILGEPDVDLGENYWEDYIDLIDNLGSFEMGPVPRGNRGWFLSLDRVWTRCDFTLNSHGTALILETPTKPGMSGSPILDVRGRAIGLVSQGGQTVSLHTGESRAEPTLQPLLAACLPGLFLPLPLLRSLRNAETNAGAELQRSLDERLAAIS